MIIQILFIASLLSQIVLLGMDKPDLKIDNLVKQVQEREFASKRNKIYEYLNNGRVYPVSMDGEMFSKVRKLCIKQKYAHVLAELVQEKNGTRILDPNSWYEGNSKNCRLLAEAIYNDARDNIEILLKAGADPNCIAGNFADHYSCQESPLFSAVDKRDTGLIELLLKHGAAPNQQYEPSGLLPLLRAVQNHVETDPDEQDLNTTLTILTLLLIHGANPDEREKAGVHKKSSEELRKCYTARELAHAYDAHEILKLFDEKKSALP